MVLEAHERIARAMLPDRRLNSEKLYDAPYQMRQVRGSITFRLIGCDCTERNVRMGRRGSGLEKRMRNALKEKCNISVKHAKVG